MALSIQARVERAEQMLTEKSIYSADCICFPKGEQPPFAYGAEARIAAELKCPLHGERFTPCGVPYLPRWFIERRERCLVGWKNEQYMKAWYASFPPELWPATTRRIGETTYLVLKDGTTFPAN